VDQEVLPAGARLKAAPSADTAAAVAAAA